MNDKTSWQEEINEIQVSKAYVSMEEKTERRQIIVRVGWQRVMVGGRDLKESIVLRLEKNC